MRQIAILCVARVTRSGYEQAQHENVSRLVARVIETCGVELEDVLPTADIDPDAWLEGPAPAR